MNSDSFRVHIQY